MPKIEMEYYGLKMQVEGEETFCHIQTALFLNHVNEDKARDKKENGSGEEDATDFMFST